MLSRTCIDSIDKLSNSINSPISWRRASITGLSRLTNCATNSSKSSSKKNLNARLNCSNKSSGTKTITKRLSPHSNRYSRIKTSSAISPKSSNLDTLKMATTKNSPNCSKQRSKFRKIPSINSPIRSNWRKFSAINSATIPRPSRRIAMHSSATRAMPMS